MSSKGYIISVSLGSVAVALVCWVHGGAGGEPAKAALKPQPVAPVRQMPALATRVPAPVRQAANQSEAPSAVAPRSQARPSPTLSTAELTARAARVEQEANHDLRRLVNLLNLSEEQQDQVFQTLVRHSSAWSPEMVALSGAGAAVIPGGKKSPATSQGTYGSSPPPETKAPATPTKPDTTEAPAKVVDPMMDEIMALLNPDQQDALTQEELDRAAWWAEILEQITPPEEVPALDGTVPVPPPTPAAGDAAAYEGADVLE